MLRHCLALTAVGLLCSWGADTASGQSGSRSGPIGGFNFQRPSRFTPAQPTFSPNFRVAGRSGRQLNQRQNQQFFGQTTPTRPFVRQQPYSQQQRQQQQQQRFIQTQNSQLRSLQSQLATARVDTRIPTGHGATFMNFLHFYNQR